ncbi:membrane protein [Mycobacterium ulcerans Agy99]|uniref:Membrane protein n=1 Tax=Mycobacterium ulcerans (strain Agy99) TaxID=362242 RepID=A0PN75_MYCUA|nr:membrane protein [Mycobacterium ulcerans Agy99]
MATGITVAPSGVTWLAIDTPDRRVGGQVVENIGNLHGPPFRLFAFAMLVLVFVLFLVFTFLRWLCD